jgi:hypothetical protein
MARLVGSAIAWNISRLIFKNKLETNRLQIYMQLFGFAKIYFHLKKNHQAPLCSGMRDTSGRHTISSSAIKR